MNPIDNSKDLTITIHGLHRSIWQPWKRVPVSRQYNVSNLKLETSRLIARKIMKIDPRLFSPDASLMPTALTLIVEHIVDFSEIVAMAIKNDCREASPSLVQWIQESVTANEILQLLQVVLQQMDINNFLRAAVMIRGINILGAPGTPDHITPLEDLKN
jgi:hypothetical protein